MRKLIYGMNLTLDGYIAAPGDDIGWACRKLWEAMSSHWPTGDPAVWASAGFRTVVAIRTTRSATLPPVSTSSSSTPTSCPAYVAISTDS